jgi:surface protein
MEPKKASKKTPKSIFGNPLLNNIGKPQPKDKKNYTHTKTKEFLVNHTVWNMKTSEMTNLSLFHNAKGRITLKTWVMDHNTIPKDMFKNADLEINIGTWNMPNVIDLTSMFEKATKLIINVEKWDMPNVTNMTEMFFNVNNLTLNFGTWNTENVTNMTKVFFNVNNLSIHMGTWIMPEVTNMYGMFMWNDIYNPQSKFEIKGLTNLNYSKVTDMSSMFRGIVGNEDLNCITEWNTENVTNMQYMFRDTVKFNQPLTKWNMENVTNTQGMFYGAKQFDQLLDWNTKNVTNMSEMFLNAQAYNKSLSLNTTNVTNMSRFFMGNIAMKNCIIEKQTKNGIFTKNNIFMNILDKSIEKNNSDEKKENLTSAQKTQMVNHYMGYIGKYYDAFPYDMVYSFFNPDLSLTGPFTGHLIKPCRGGKKIRKKKSKKRKTRKRKNKSKKRKSRKRKFTKT